MLTCLVHSTINLSFNLNFHCQQNPKPWCLALIWPKGFFLCFHYGLQQTLRLSNLLTKFLGECHLAWWDNWIFLPCHFTWMFTEGKRRPFLLWNMEAAQLYSDMGTFESIKSQVWSLPRHPGAKHTVKKQKALKNGWGKDIRLNVNAHEPRSYQTFMKYRDHLLTPIAAKCGTTNYQIKGTIFFVHAIFIWLITKYLTESIKVWSV